VGSQPQPKADEPLAQKADPPKSTADKSASGGESHRPDYLTFFTHH